MKFVWFRSYFFCCYCCWCWCSSVSSSAFISVREKRVKSVHVHFYVGTLFDDAILWLYHCQCENFNEKGLRLRFIIALSVQTSIPTFRPDTRNTNSFAKDFSMTHFILDVNGKRKKKRDAYTSIKAVQKSIFSVFRVVIMYFHLAQHFPFNTSFRLNEFSFLLLSHSHSIAIWTTWWEKM